uniref:Uncharacterized protein n=1 Tax=Ixodes scapularis TaxID=6945 RepID=A0A4D5RYY0_IXOSC
MVICLVVEVGVGVLSFFFVFYNIANRPMSLSIPCMRDISITVHRMQVPVHATACAVSCSVERLQFPRCMPAAAAQPNWLAISVYYCWHFPL